MGTSVSATGGVVREVNVVPLIDILLVLLVIFMVIPHRQVGLPASLPEKSRSAGDPGPVGPIVVAVDAGGTVRLNGLAVEHEELRSHLEQVLRLRANRVAFLQGDRSLEFQRVAEVLDVMRSAGASPVGLVTSELEKNR